MTQPIKKKDFGGKNLGNRFSLITVHVVVTLIGG